MTSLTHHTTTDPQAEEHLVSSRERVLSRPPRRERVVELTMSCGFVVAALAIALLVPGGGSPDPVALVVLVLLGAIVSRVEFEVGTGFTVPSVLLLFPMLYLLPAALVPLATAAGYLLSFAYSAARGRRHISRAIIVPAVAWHAVGPALVVAIADPGSPDWADWPVAVCVVLAYIACDAIASLISDTLGRGLPARALLPAAGWVYLTDLLLAPTGFALAIAVHEAPLTTLVVLPLCGLLMIFAAERRQRLDQALELSQAYRGTALLLGDVVETDHEYTGTHSRDVVDLALAVGRKLGLDARTLRDLEFGALLHDVGKIAIPKEIIDKPGPLDDEEWALMKTHTIAGQRMLDSVGGVLGGVGVIVRASHEDYDGSGYPDGLAGEDIPLASRICTACDAFSAMVTDRSYRRALSREVAVAELRRCAGSQFDPRVVEALVAVLDESPVGAARALEPTAA